MAILAVRECKNSKGQGLLRPSDIEKVTICSKNRAGKIRALDF
jgi:hypothetical protein